MKKWAKVVALCGVSAGLATFASTDTALGAWCTLASIGVGCLAIVAAFDALWA